jgi:hypothetical protein
MCECNLQGKYVVSVLYCWLFWLSIVYVYYSALHVREAELSAIVLISEDSTPGSVL